jgi:mannose-1-phosphate guanylyltransferase
MLHALILAGGSGTRFWPLSRRGRPKQLLRLFSEKELVAETRDRLTGLVPADRIFVVAPERLAPELRRALPDLRPGAFVLEPAARNTAPAVALATAIVGSVSSGAILAILPADHVIDPPAALRRSIEDAARLAETPGRIVLFGIKPSHPATGYGYIRRAAGKDATNGAPVPVVEFIEKPDAVRAAALAADPACLWNSGIVVASVRTILDAFASVATGFAEPLREIGARLGAGASAGDPAVAAAYLRMPEGPFDKAVLERWPDIAVIEATFEWDDVGDFRAIERHVAPDPNGNVARGTALFLDGAKGCTVVAPGGSPLVIASGVDDLLVVCTADAVLVCRKGDGERIRAVVEAVRREGRSDLLD